ncbi:hypothetical protein Sgleb_12560 [Streptomyces glebosus]|uniref:Uncharacterized protein n=1 Tax=Streptomyces glebosus TaxID=249580 RepID=A0A640SP78_9ACTN|nr:hypothetical protein Sgleb_12560 [Streptomyces glebosus]GHG78704.1 hypothetical protein GCM10010513_55510 [Streptomyces glebosus]
MPPPGTSRSTAPTPALDAHVHLDTHSTHPGAVIAVLTGLQARIARMGLEAADWTVVAENALVLVRIDHEEPDWAPAVLPPGPARVARPGWTPCGRPPRSS